jgi:sugar-specific transcriptional regulator TrmB
MDTNAILTQVGMTELEADIYSTLLKEGTCGAGELSKKTGIHRRNVYDCVDRMLQKGYISYIRENNRKRYVAAHPHVLQQKLVQRQKDFEQILPALLLQHDTISEKKETSVFTGKAGLRMIFEDQLTAGTEVLVNATTVDVEQVLSYFFPKYHLLRKEKRIATRMIFNEAYRKGHKRKLSSLPFCDVRYIENFNTSPMSQYIYGDRVAIVVWGDNPVGILIKEKAVADGFRQSFEILWKIGQE